jgi:hypothetical protein
MIFIFEVFKAYGASSAQSIVVLSENISDFLMCIIEYARFIGIFPPIIREQLELLFDMLEYFIDLVIIESLA